METGLHFTVIWEDDDVLEVRAVGKDGQFSGVSNVYVARDYMKGIATQLAGFPANNTDERIVVLGDFGSEWAGGAMSLRFYCTNRAGHAYVEVHIESGEEVAGVKRRATVCFPIEAMSMNAFTSQLERIEETSGGAFLQAGG